MPLASIAVSTRMWIAPLWVLPQLLMRMELQFVVLQENECSESFALFSVVVVVVPYKIKELFSSHNGVLTLFHILQILGPLNQQQTTKCLRLEPCKQFNKIFFVFSNQFIWIRNSPCHSYSVSSLHSDKENEPCHRVTIENPYVTRKKVLTSTARQLANSNVALPNLKVPPRQSSKALSSLAPPSSKPTSTTTVSGSQINEDSPTIKRILATTGYASVEEFLASRNANSSKAPAVNGANSAATNGNKATTKGSKSTNGSKAAPNVAKNSAKSTKGLTNPKKKAKSKQFAWHSWPLQNNDCIHSHSHSLTYSLI